MDMFRVRRNSFDADDPNRTSFSPYYTSIRNILFLYYKLNPGMKYVQGMNELLAPLYYVVATDPLLLVREHADADAFFMFSGLMSEVRDRFMPSMDKSDRGIHALMGDVNSLLKQVDLPLWVHMEENGVRQEFYSFRWVTLLLSQVICQVHLVFVVNLVLVGFTVASLPCRQLMFPRPFVIACRAV